MDLGWPYISELKKYYEAQSPINIILKNKIEIETKIQIRDNKK